MVFLVVVVRFVLLCFLFEIIMRTLRIKRTGFINKLLITPRGFMHNI